MARVRDNIVLSVERKLQIAQAFAAWYGRLPKGGERMKAMTSIGVVVRMAFVFKNGDRTPTPNSLARLFQMTGDRSFLYSRDEKVRIARMNPRAGSFPSKDEWPDRDDEIPAVTISVTTPVATTDDVASLGREIAALAAKIRAFGELAESDPRRLRARKVLVAPAMRLFRAVMTLELEVPRDFADLLGKLDVIITLFK